MSVNTINENISWNYFKSDKDLAKKIGIFYGLAILNAILNFIPIMRFILTSLVSMLIADIQAQYIRKMFNIGQGKANG